MKPHGQSSFGHRPFAKTFGGSDPAPPRANAQTVGDVWPHYLDGGYFTPEGHLRRDYVSREKVEPLIQAMARSEPELNQHQIRRFFQHCRALEARLRSRKFAWPELEAEFCKLDAAAAQSLGRTPGERKIPALFYDFLRRNVAAVRSEKDFLQGFLPHFEALVGFGALHLEKSDRN
jgi:CRISPR type III-A-associated protein Csm2